MNFDLSEDQQMIRDATARFVDGFDLAAGKTARGAGGGYSVDRWQALAELGLLDQAAPEVMGGLGGSRLDLVLTAETLGHSLAIDPWLENGVIPIKLAAAAGAQALVEMLASGRERGTLAFAEPGARYSLDPRAVKLEDSGAVSGTKTLVLGAAASSTLLVTAAGDDGKFALASVAADQSEVQMRGYRVIDGSMASEITFHGAAGTILEITREAFLDVIADARLLAAAEMLGAAQRLFEETLDYARTREQFGVAIGSFQVLQHRLVDCYALLEQSRSLVLRCALEDSDGPALRTTAAGTKAMVGRAARSISLKAVQIHGGMGQTDELAIGRGLKRIMLLERFLGDEATCLADYASASRSLPVMAA